MTIKQGSTKAPQSLSYLAASFTKIHFPIPRSTSLNTLSKLPPLSQTKATQGHQTGSKQGSEQRWAGWSGPAGRVAEEALGPSTPQSDKRTGATEPAHCGCQPHIRTTAILGIHERSQVCSPPQASPKRPIVLGLLCPLGVRGASSGAREQAGRGEAAAGSRSCHQPQKWHSYSSECS